MKLKHKLLLTLFAIIALAACFGLGWKYSPCNHREKIRSIGETQQIPSIPDIQRMVGAKPDGIVGPNTIGKWEAAYANQETAKFMTPSGGPKCLNESR